MNFNEAIDTLNKHNHRGSKGWHPSGHVDGIKVSPGYPFAIILSSLEAIAIAKALVEQEQAEKPIKDFRPVNSLDLEKVVSMIDKRIGALQEEVAIAKKHLGTHDANIGYMGKRFCELDTAQAFTQKYAENVEERVEKLERRSVRMSGEYVTVNGLREILKDAVVVLPEAK